MRSWGVSLEWIGLLKILALPWMLKFLWAPRFDRGGRIRGILLMQSLTVILLLCAAWLDPTSAQTGAIFALCFILLLLNICSAIQDTATDGFAVRLLPSFALGVGNSLQVAGYKVGLLIGGSGLLLLVGYVGWTSALYLIAAILASGSILVYFGAKAANDEPLPAPSCNRLSIWHIYREFFSYAGVKHALCIVVIYKLGDSLGSAMIRPMLIDSGFSLSDVGQITLVASLISLPAAWLGGLMFSRVGELWALLSLGALQMMGLLAWAWVAFATPGQSLIFIVAIFEQCTDVASTVALFAFMMRQCRPGCESGDYTAMACLQAALAGAIGALSGFVASAFGYLGLFLLAALIAGAVLMFIPRMYSRIHPAATV